MVVEALVACALQAAMLQKTRLDPGNVSF